MHETPDKVLDPVEAQRACLDEIQAEQQPALEAAGTVATARTVLIEKHKYFDVANGVETDPDDLARLTASLTGARIVVAEYQGKLKLRFSSEEPFNEGTREVHRYLDVAERVGDVVKPIGRFTDADARVMFDLHDKIEAAKAAGKLADLSYDGTSIVDPNSDSAFA